MFESERGDIWFTMGPATNNPNAVGDLVEAGVTGVRLTFSFGTQSLQSQRAQVVRNAAAAADTDCTVVADLAGEQVRFGEFHGTTKVTTDAGDRWTLVPADRETVGDGRLPVDSESFIATLSGGDRLVVGDGAVRLDVTETDGTAADCEVVTGGELNPNRGLVVQDGGFEPDSLTEDDRDDLRYVADSPEFDAVCLSFVSDAGDVAEAREVLASGEADQSIVAKIETPEGVENAPEIAAAADAVMVARGDLALFLPWTELETHVRSVVEAAERADVPWVLATQVAEGRERYAYPTRAEICDLSRWAREGADGVLLSYETAFGDAPVETVEAVSMLLDETAEGV